MDTLRGNFGSFDESELPDEDVAEDEPALQTPPSPVGQDERRMQVRAYNHWAGMLQDRNFPSIEDLDPETLPDFGPHSVLLDFTAGIENPAIPFLGAQLAGECGTNGDIETLDDVPSRSLLSRITDHYMQILANQAPIGFEAEFVNQRGATILYRGILLPFSSDDDTIDFIYGVINWKETADQLTSDELLLEIDQALEAGGGDDAEEEPAEPRTATPVGDWADGPAGQGDAYDDEGDGQAHDAVEDDPDEDDADESGADAGEIHTPLGLTGLRNKPTKTPIDLTGIEPIVPVGSDPMPVGASGAVPEAYEAPGETGYDHGGAAFAGGNRDDTDDPMPMPSFGAAGANAENRFASLLGADLANEDEPEADFDDDADDWSSPLVSPARAAVEQPGTEPVDTAGEPAPAVEPAEPATEIVLPEDGGEPAGLHDCLAAARELAQAARSSEDRSRAALYAAVGRAYDVSIAAEEQPEEFAELVADSGLTVQDRAPMTPVVKLVFGAEYDKTRLTEYAAVLGHAHRMGLARGALAGFLSQAEGGLKGVVNAERRLRREESGKPVVPADAPRDALARKLRALETMALADLDPQGAEFGVVMIRRLGTGEIVVLGEVRNDVPLVEKVARKLVA